MLPSPSKWSNAAVPRKAARPTRGARPGCLTLVTGCMFSGKTTELIRRIDQAPASTVRAFKHLADDRYHASKIVSHAGKSIPAIGIENPGELLRYALARTTLVAIDEGHFFDVRLIDAIGRLVNRGVDVVVAALQPDSWGRPFPLVTRLTELAGESMTLTATCARCSAAADRTQRLTPIENGKMVVDPANYEPRCVQCWRPPPESSGT